MNREAKLSASVCDWIMRRGFEVFTEIGFYSSSIDIVGIDFDLPYVVTVELKTNLSRKVIHQAYRSGIYANEAYCAVPTKPKLLNIDRCKRLKIGVLRITDRVEVISPSFCETRFNRTWQKKLLERAKHYPRGGMGGLPCEDGKGPAQEVYTEVQRLKKENSKLRWRDLFDLIPNHYSNYRSMQTAMYLVEQRQRAKERRRNA